MLDGQAKKKVTCFPEDELERKHRDGCLVSYPGRSYCIGKLVRPILPIWLNYFLQYVLNFSIAYLDLPIRLGDVMVW